MQIVMLAAENGALSGGKVGGIADVVRDAPRALGARGHQVSVLTPGYQSLSQLPGAHLVHTLTVAFAGRAESLALFAIETPDASPLVRHFVLEHPLFAACGVGSIYCHDAFEPFATDATKFALFCRAACGVILSGAIGYPDVLHLHDWHAALVLPLRQADPSCAPLAMLPTVFTIHNLSLQGVRPFAHNPSSLQAWYPDLAFDPTPLRDPRYLDCINLMRIGIRLADRVHVVSPRYAGEILLPSQPDLGLIRGEGLEADLAHVRDLGRLHGILNGCDYDVVAKTKRPTRTQFLHLARKTIAEWVGAKSQIPVVWWHAEQRIGAWLDQPTREACIVASIGRLTAQKVRLLRAPVDPANTALDRILTALGDNVLIVLGSGDPDYERFLLDAMLCHKNLLFLCGYSEPLSNALYAHCDAFLMPSSFEPCGISQLLAMRAGKPVLAHAVGGLADTVIDGSTGFTFAGADEAEQVANLLETFDRMLHLRLKNRSAWSAMSATAAAQRFTWDSTIEQYLSQLYPAA
jgi:starch synthase